MPKSSIAIPHDIVRLSILDENGIVDDHLEPDIPEKTLLRLYRAMLLGRRFDQRMIDLQRQGRIATFPPSSGHESAHLGAVANLKPADWYIPAYREVPADLWRGRSMESVLLYNAGFNEGIQIDEHQNNLPISIPVGSQILHAVGIAWGIKYRSEDSVAMTFFGDGATSQGDFHEGLNFAGVYRLPVIFVCQNNQWAISVPVHKQTLAETLAQKALAYGIPGIQVDGNDILAVYAAAQEAVDRARSGGGPTLMECVTYRMVMHTTSDDPKRYQNPEEVEAWKNRDPLPRFRKYLQQRGLISAGGINELETEIKDEIQAAVEKAEADAEGLGNPLDMFDHIYDTLPEETRRQKAYLRKTLSG